MGNFVSLETETYRLDFVDSLRKAEDIIIDVWPPSHDFGMNLFFEVETLFCYVLLYIVFRLYLVFTVKVCSRKKNMAVCD